MEKEYIQQELTKFNVADAAIEQLKEEYMPLKIDGIEDTKGYRTVHAAHMAVKSKRVEVEKKRKELKADSLAFGRAVDAEAKRITALLTPIEEHLATEKQAIIDEKARIKAEAERKERERKERERKERERAELEARLRAEAEARAEEERKKQEAAAKAAAERLAKIQAEQEAERQRLAAIAKEQAEREAAALAKAEEERLALEQERQAIQAERERLETLAREQETKEQEPEPEQVEEIQAPAPVEDMPERTEPRPTYSLTLYGITSKEEAERIAGEYPELSCRIEELDRRRDEQEMDG